MRRAGARLLCHSVLAPSIALSRHGTRRTLYAVGSKESVGVAGDAQAAVTAVERLGCEFVRLRAAGTIASAPTVAPALTTQWLDCLEVQEMGKGL